jgi:molybdopterin synthase sulfur carrier subunit
MIRVVLPQHLRTLARVGSEVKVEIAGQVTQRAVIDASGIIRRKSGGHS